MRKFATMIAIAFAMTTQAQVSTVYIGSYTNGESEGIYTLQFDNKTGSLQEKKLVAKTNNPSYLIISADKKMVYAVTESSNFNNTDSGAIASFKVTKDGSLKKTAELSSYGKNPCHLSLNEKENRLVVSNYSEGTFSVFSLKRNGDLKKMLQVEDLNKEGITAHTHSAQFYKDQLYIADLGINTLEHYTSKNNSYVATKSISMEANSGPRHFAMLENQSYIYVINEYGNTISTLKKVGNSYANIGDISTLRDGYKGKSFCADIHLSKDEKFLYGSNRGENSIVVFERNLEDGSLKKIQNISCHGNWPRNFVITPEGKHLLVANKKSNNISVFLRDEKTGKLTFLHDVEAANPTCLKF